MVSYPASPLDSSWIDQAAFDSAALTAADVEDFLREVARDELPRALRWLVEHPRLLAVAYRLLPHWRPTIVYGADGDLTVGMVRRRDGMTLVLPS